jgi:hypothetical protein
MRKIIGRYGITGREQVRAVGLVLGILVGRLCPKLASAKH